MEDKLDNSDIDWGCGGGPKDRTVRRSSHIGRIEGDDCRIIQEEEVWWRKKRSYMREGAGR